MSIPTEASFNDFIIDISMAGAKRLGCIGSEEINNIIFNITPETTMIELEQLIEKFCLCDCGSPKHDGMCVAEWQESMDNS